MVGEKNTCLRITYKSEITINKLKQQKLTDTIVFSAIPQKSNCAKPTHLLFWIRSDNELENIGVCFWNKEITGKENLNILEVADYTKIGRKWSLVTIPVSDGNYYTNLESAPYICFFPLKDSVENTFYVDNIQFCNIVPANVYGKFKKDLFHIFRNREKFVNKTDHFHVYSNYTDYICFHSGRCCEMVYRDLGQIFDRPVQLAQPVMVAVFRKQSEFFSYLKTVGYNAGHIRGVFLVSGDFSFIGSYFDDEHGEADVYANLVHETAHLFLQKYLNGISIPLWLNEGIAQYYEISTYEYGNNFRNEKEKRKNMAKQLGPCSLQQLFSTFDTDYNSAGFSVSKKYLYSYSFVSFLYKKNIMKSLIRKVKQGDDPESALIDIFQCSLSQIEDQWDSFLKNQW
jgi:hypothetical protein